MSYRVYKAKYSAKKFFENTYGGATLQSALLFGAVAMALAVLVTPQLQHAADIYAENKALGIDRVITGSVEKKRTYTIRKSVLDK